MYKSVFLPDSPLAETISWYFCFAGMDANHLTKFVLLLFLITATSCEQETDVVDKDCTGSGLTLTLLGSTDTSCGASAGVVEVEASGGFGDYRYQLDEVLFRTVEFLTALLRGYILWA